MKDVTVEVESPEDAQLGENLCVLQFTHYQDSREVTFDASSKNLFLMRGATRCVVELADGGVLIGDAWCYRKDWFDRRKGERHALTDALRLTAVTREDRRWIWQKYLQARPVLPKKKAGRRTMAGLEKKLAKRLADVVVAEVLR